MLCPPGGGGTGHTGAVDRADVEAWVSSYAWQWRSPGTEHLGEPSSPRHLVPLRRHGVHRARGARRGEGALGRPGATAPDEAFTFTSEVVAVDGDTAVVRAEVEYSGPDTSRWRDLWVLRFAEDGRCQAFEEWPAAPAQRDGHRGPPERQVVARRPALALDRSGGACGQAPLLAAAARRGRPAGSPSRRARRAATAAGRAPPRGCGSASGTSPALTRTTAPSLSSRRWRWCSLRLADPATSKLASTLVRERLACCPPGPPEVEAELDLVERDGARAGDPQNVLHGANPTSRRCAFRDLTRPRPLGPTLDVRSQGPRCSTANGPIW